VVKRVALALVMALLQAYAGPALAQSSCRIYHMADFGGFTYEGTGAGACAALAIALGVDVPPWAPVTVTSCTVTSSAVTAVLHTATGDNVDFAVPDTGPCASPPDPPASSASGPEFTQGQASNLMVWGFLVLCFGVGFIGGRFR
jgi:hypothetical protein